MCRLLQWGSPLQVMVYSAFFLIQRCWRIWSPATKPGLSVANFGTTPIFVPVVWVTKRGPNLPATLFIRHFLKLMLINTKKILFSLLMEPVLSIRALSSSSIGLLIRYGQSMRGLSVAIRTQPIYQYAHVILSATRFLKKRTIFRSTVYKKFPRKTSLYISKRSILFF